MSAPLQREFTTKFNPIKAKVNSNLVQATTDLTVLEMWVADKRSDIDAAGIGAKIDADLQTLHASIETKINNELKNALTAIDRQIKACVGAYEKCDPANFEKAAVAVDAEIEKAKTKTANIGIWERRDALSADAKLAGIFEQLEEHMKTKDEKLEYLKKRAPLNPVIKSIETDLKNGIGAANKTRGEQLLASVEKKISENADALNDLGIDFTEKLNELRAKWGAGDSAPAKTAPAAANPAADVKKFEGVYRIKSNAAKNAAKTSLDAMTKINDLKATIAEYDAVIATMDGKREEIEAELSEMEAQFQETIAKACAKQMTNANRLIQKAKQTLEKGNEAQFQKDLKMAKDAVMKPIHKDMQITPLDKKDAAIAADAKTEEMFAEYEVLIAKEQELISQGRLVDAPAPAAATPAAKAATQPSTTATPKIPTGKFTPEQTAFINTYKKASSTAKMAVKKVKEGPDAFDALELVVVENQEMVDAIPGMKEFADYEIALYKQQHQENINKICETKVKGIATNLKNARAAITAADTKKFETQLAAMEKNMEFDIEETGMTPMTRKDLVIEQFPALAAMYEDYEDLMNNKESLMEKASAKLSLGAVDKEIKQIMGWIKTAAAKDPAKADAYMEQALQKIAENEEELKSGGFDYSADLDAFKSQIYKSFMGILISRKQLIERFMREFDTAVAEHRETLLNQAWTNYVNNMTKNAHDERAAFSVMDKRDEMIQNLPESAKWFEHYDTHSPKISWYQQNCQNYHALDEIERNLHDGLSDIETSIKHRNFAVLVGHAENHKRLYTRCCTIREQSTGDKAIEEILNRLDSECFRGKISERIRADPQVFVREEYEACYSRFAKALALAKAQTPLYYYFSQEVESVREALVYSRGFVDQSLKNLAAVTERFEAVDKELMDSKLTIDDIALLDRILGGMTLLGYFENDEVTFLEQERGQLVAELEEAYKTYTNKTGKKISKVEAVLSGNAKYKPTGNEARFRENAAKYIEQFKNGTIKPKASGAVYAQMANLFRLADVKVSDASADFLAEPCLKILEKDLASIKNDLESFNGTAKMCMKWVDSFRCDSYAPIRGMMHLIEAIISVSPTLCFGKLPQAARDAIEFYNTCICLVAAAKIHVMKTSMNNKSAAINAVNACRVRALQTVIKAHMGSVKQASVKKALDEVLAKVDVQPADLVMYEYEKTVLLDSVKQKLAGLSDAAKPQDIMTALSYTDYLRAFYMYDDSCVSLVEEVDKKAVSVFGFVPNMDYVAGMLAPVFARTPDQDAGITKGILSPVDNWGSASRIENFGASAIYNVRSMIGNKMIASQLHYLHQHIFSASQYSAIFTTKIPGNHSATQWHNSDARPFGGNTDAVDYAINDMIEHPTGLDNEVSEKGMYLRHVVAPLTQAARIPYMLQLAPEVVPSNEFSYGLAVPSTKDYTHWQNDETNVIDFTEFERCVNSVFESVTKFATNEKMKVSHPCGAHFILSIIELANPDKEAIVGEVNTKIQAYLAELERKRLARVKNLYEQFIAPFDNEAKIVHEGQETFIVKKTDEGFMITATNTTNSYLGTHGFTYKPNHAGFEMILDYNNGYAMEEGGECNWYYIQRIAQTHQKMTSYDVKVEGNIPEIIPILMTHAFKMPPLIEDIEEQIKREEEEAAAALLQAELDRIARATERIARTTYVYY